MGVLRFLHYSQEPKRAETTLMVVLRKWPHGENPRKSGAELVEALFFLPSLSSPPLYLGVSLSCHCGRALTGHGEVVVVVVAVSHSGLELTAILQ